LRRRRPFRPYLIELVSGDRFRVTHPEAVALREYFFVYMTPQMLYRLFDGSDVCQVLDEDSESVARE